MNFDINLMFFALFIAEQIIMIQLGSYPYRWGLTFARRSLPYNIKIEDVGGFFGRLKIKKTNNGNIYFRYKHFPLTWGPYVFVGEVCKEEPNELNIKLGPLTCLFFIAFIVQGLIYGVVSTLISIITVGSFLWYFFFSFLKGYEKIINKEKT
jgi:hypothetical protein